MEVQPYVWLATADIRLPDGWSIVIEDLLQRIDAIVAQEKAAFFALQVKEKLGGLRFSYRVEPQVLRDQIDALIHDADKRCQQTCAFCGAVA